MRVNVSKLRGKIKEAGFTQEALAKELSIDRSTFSRKMKSEALAFSIGEMHQITEKLCLSKKEAAEIFLF